MPIRILQQLYCHPILYMRKWRHREADWFSHSLTAGVWLWALPPPLQTDPGRKFTEHGLDGGGGLQIKRATYYSTNQISEYT